MSRLPEPGETWNNRYEIRTVLGRGGFGRVYGAWDPLLERDVAIKMLRFSEDFTPTDHQRFRRETNIAASLEHRNIVTVYDGGEHRGLLYLVMRFVAGRDLRFELEEGPLAPGRAASVVRQVADALDYAHSKGLVHRDVKPGNILCQSDSDTVFLADFGISRRVDQTTDNPVTQGLAPATLAYAAPEQMRTDVRVDGRADIYALGCVLFECLTGGKPFDGEVVAMINAHLHEAPPRPSDRDRSLSRTWDRVIATAMAKDPADRFQRCSELATAVAFAVPPDPGPDTGHLPIDDVPTRQVPTRDEAVAVPSRSRTRHLERPDDPTEHAARAPADPPRQRSRGEPPDRPTAPWAPPIEDGSSATPSPPPPPPAAGRSDPSPPDAGSAGPPPPSGTRPDDGSADAPRAPGPVTGPWAATATTPSRRRHRDGGHGEPDQRGRRTGLAVLALVAVALLVWFAWPLLDPGGADDAADGSDAAAEDAAGGTGSLDDEQVTLVEAFGAYAPSDCRPPTREPLAGQEVGVACTSADQAPTRVVFRRFGSTAERDAALADLGRSADGGDCRDDHLAAHPYIGDAGEGQVVCVTDSTTAGLSWSMPGDPLLGSARLDDPGRADDLYDWWADQVGRTDG